MTEATTTLTRAAAQAARTEYSGLDGLADESLRERFDIGDGVVDTATVSEIEQSPTTEGR